MFGIGATELVLILVLALIFIGPKKLPEVARTFGRTYRELQNALEGIRRDFVEAGDSIRHEVESPAAEVPHPEAPVGSVETKLESHPAAPVGSVETKPAAHPEAPVGSDPS
jgi:Tat protein translocase TatB subunit